MNRIFQIFMLVVLTFVIASIAVADLSEVTFDSSNCIELSDGSMQKVSIPLPDGWKNTFNNQKMSDEAHQRYQKMKDLIVDDFLANYYNPKKRTEYIEIIRLEKMRGVSVPYEEFKKLKDEAAQSIDDGSLKSKLLDKHPNDKDMGKRFQIFKPHEIDDHSFQVTEVGLTVHNKSIVFFIGTLAVMWMHERMFAVSVWTEASNQSKTMDKMTETRYFISHWVDAILEANGCDANDMDEATAGTGTTDSSDTVDTSDRAEATEENISKDVIDENEEKSVKESNEVTDTKDETVRPKSKIVSFIGKIKRKIKLIINNEDKDYEASNETSTEDDDETSIKRHRKKTKFLEIFVLVLLGGLIARLVKRRQ